MKIDFHPLSLQLMKVIGITKVDVEAILEAPDRYDTKTGPAVGIPESELKGFAGRNYELFWALKWFGARATVVSGVVREGARYITLCATATDQLPAGQIDKGMSAQEVLDVFARSFTRDTLFRRGEVNVIEYEKWYKQNPPPAPFRLDSPAFKAISTPRLEAKSQATQARTYADILEDKCYEFRTLIDTAKKEEELHVWLKKKGNLMFFGAEVEWVKSKMKFGTRFVSDFVVKRPTQPYLLVEIETTEKVFNADCSKSKRFNHACEQVLDWQSWINDSIDFFRKETGLDDLYRPEGLVVMGRSADINKQLAKERWRDLKSKSDPDVMTYDEMITRVRTIVKQLRALR